MVDIKYSIAYSEILEILKHIPLEDYNKIPKDRIELFEANANKDYIFTYNPAKTLNEQNVSKIAKCIIAILFRDYWATPTQREQIIAKQNKDRKKLEKEKRKRYNPDNFLQNNKNIENKNASFIEVKNEKWYEKLFLFIKSILKK